MSTDPSLIRERRAERQSATGAHSANGRIANAARVTGKPECMVRRFVASEK
jgi:hypothetical protein